MTHRYLIVLERSATGYAAFAPDVPGCVATGATRDDAEREMREALAFHLDGLRELGEPVPEPRTEISYVEVGA